MQEQKDVIDVNIEDKKKRVVTALKEQIVEIEKLIPRDVFNFDEWYFAGGCCYSLWNDKEVKDYDIFCKNKKAVKKLKDYFKSNKNKANCMTKNAITVGKYQFVIKHIGKPEVEVGKFDFKHNMSYYDNKQGLVSLSGWNYISSNELSFNTERARDILNIITRIPKFVDRGMEISQKEILDILELGTRPTKIFRERQSIKKSRSGKSRY